MLPIMTRAVQSWLVGLFVLATACGASEAEIREVKMSGYSADFALVYNAALEAVRKQYPRLVEDARAQVIKTSWHPVKIRTGGNQPSSTPQGGRTQSNQIQPSGGTFRTGSIRRKQFFIRFDVVIHGGKPWRVKLTGHASSWDVGGTPTPLTGAAVPSWLAGRENSLRMSIHDRLKQYAVKLKFRKRAKPGAAPLKLAKYGNLPDKAAKTVATVHRAADARDAAELRANMVDEFTWSFGEDPNADVAVAMWQADSTTLAKLASVLAAGCRVDDGGGLVTCPPQYTEQASYIGYRAGFKREGDRWKMSFFVMGD